MPTEIAKLDDKGIIIKSTRELQNAIQMVIFSAVCPKDYRGKPADALVAALSGRRVGWDLMQSLQYIAVVNGRPSMWGDGPAGLVAASGKVEWLREWWEQDGKEVAEPNYAKLDLYPDSLTACWQGKRRDNAEASKIVRFSVADAKSARLWKKAGTWSDYPKRMLVLRARSWGYRDYFSDALQGIMQAEEVLDIPRHAPDPLEAIIEAEATVVEPAPEQPPTDADKKALVEAVKGYVAAIAPAEPLTPQEIIKSAIAHEFKTDTANFAADKILTLAGLEIIRAGIVGGNFDLETGQFIPPSVADVEQHAAELFGDENDRQPGPTH